MIHPINIITQTGVGTSLAHHRTYFGLVLAAHITHLLTFSSHLFVEDFGFYLRCHFIKSYQLSLWIYLLHKELSMFNVIMTILIKIIQYLYNDKCSSLHWGQGRALGPAERFLLGRQRWNNTSTLSHFWSFMLNMQTHLLFLQLQFWHLYTFILSYLFPTFILLYLITRIFSLPQRNTFKLKCCLSCFKKIHWISKLCSIFWTMGLMWVLIIISEMITIVGHNYLRWIGHRLVIFISGGLGRLPPRLAML